MKYMKLIKNLIIIILGLFMLVGIILVVYPVYWMISSEGSILGYGFAILEILIGLLILITALFIFKILKK